VIRDGIGLLPDPIAAPASLLLLLLLLLEGL
jgi:hypothetical protein